MSAEAPRRFFNSGPTTPGRALMPALYRTKTGPFRSLLIRQAFRSSDLLEIATSRQRDDGRTTEQSCGLDREGVEQLIVALQSALAGQLQPIAEEPAAATPDAPASGAHGWTREASAARGTGEGR